MTTIEDVVLPSVLAREGGPWLGAARNWLQWNTQNGDTVTFGRDSFEPIHPQLRVCDVEDLAAHVAAAAITEERKRARIAAIRDRVSNESGIGEQ